MTGLCRALTALGAAAGVLVLDRRLRALEDAVRAHALMTQPRTPAAPSLAVRLAALEDERQRLDRDLTAEGLARADSMASHPTARRHPSGATEDDRPLADVVPLRPESSS